MIKYNIVNIYLYMKSRQTPPPTVKRMNDFKDYSVFYYYYYNSLISLSLFIFVLFIGFAR